MWKFFFRLMSKPIPSIIFYVFMLPTTAGLGTNTDLFLSNKITASQYDFGGLRFDYFGYIVVLLISGSFLIKNIYGYYKTDKSLKTTCIIHCVGFVLLVTVILFNLFTKVRFMPT
jgi:hypothetical protein